jgi:hypothetical protein
MGGGRPGNPASPNGFVGGTKPPSPSPGRPAAQYGVYVPILHESPDAHSDAVVHRTYDVEGHALEHTALKGIPGPVVGAPNPPSPPRPPNPAPGAPLSSAVALLEVLGVYVKQQLSPPEHALVVEHAIDEPVQAPAATHVPMPGIGVLLA